MRHRKSIVNEDSPDKEFLQTVIDSLKSTIAKNDLDMKKLKEDFEWFKMNLKELWKKQTITKRKNSIYNERLNINRLF